MSTAAVWAVARVQLRRRWLSMLVLALLAGVAGAVVTGAAAVAHRTASAYDRLAEATALDDARVLIFDDGVDVEQIRSWPEVSKSWPSTQVLGGVVDGPVAFLAVSLGPPRDDDLFTPVLIEGRAPRDDAPYEVMVPSLLADDIGIGVGDTVPLKLLTPEEVTQFDTGFGEPDGPRVDLKVVGIMRVARAWVNNGVGPVIGSPALLPEVSDHVVGRNLLLRLADGPADVPAVKRRLDRLAEQAPSSATGEEYGVLSASYPTSTPNPEIRAAITTLVGGLLVFLAVALLGGLVAVGQALGRHHAIDAGAQRIEAALGFTRAERVAARLVPAAGGAVVAAVVALAGGLVAGRVEPLGALRQYEPDPGWWVNPWVLVAGSLGTTLAFLGLAALTAARSLRGAEGSVPARPAIGLSAVGRRAPLVAGLAFALRGGRGRATVPVRATFAVVVFGIAGGVSVASFDSSLDRLVGTPARYGWVADFAIVDSQPRDLADLAADERVAAIVDVATTQVEMGGRRITGLAAKELKGPVPLTVVAGRLPRRDSEVALGVRGAERQQAALGSLVPLTTRDGDRRELTVVGLVAMPYGESFDTAAFLTGRTLAAAQRAATFSHAFVELAPGVDSEPLYRELAQTREMDKATPPAEVANLAALGRLPGLLGVFLVLLVVVVLGHSLVLTVRRRAAELAVLRVIGLTPVQVAAALGVMAATVSVVGLVLGSVLGLAIGRVVWGEVARGVGVAGDLAVPWMTLGTAVPAVLLGAAVLALLPARRAARLRPAAVLQSE